MPDPVSDDRVTAKPACSRGPTEDTLAILIGWVILLIALLGVRVTTSADESGEVVTSATNALSSWIGKPGSWTANPADALGGWPAGLPKLTGILFSGLLIGGLFAIGISRTDQSTLRFLRGYLGIFILGGLAYLLAGQSLIKAYNLEYPLWAIGVALIIANTVGIPNWLRPATRTELYIKTGLVLLGSEILLSRLLALGLPGVFVAWVVTPIVLITTYWFGQRVLKMQSATLNMVISADMSVCGVSAAIASAAACRAKKEELSLAIGLSLSFTVIMMIVMPICINAMGMDPVLGGAWIGGTIDATGAVAVAGELLGKEALPVAVTIKMIQNILIGVVAFGIAVYWTKYKDPEIGRSVGWSEVWTRFPKFIIGFMAASIFFSMIHWFASDGPFRTTATIEIAGTVRSWLFCMAFVSIGLETNFSELKKHLAGGKPLILYVCGQSLNLVLTLAMAYLMFNVVFPDAAK